MAYWLVKEEPEKYNFAKLLKDGETAWDWVRNYEARKYLREMTVGDELIYYLTGKEGDWSCVDVTPGESFARPVTLKEIKADPKLADCALVKQGWLSVVPLSAAEFKRIRSLGKKA